ncbi:MAG: sulfatase-like hydrolase/transferase [Planctomycetaceae bacterium]
MTLLSACRRRWFTVSIATLLLISGLPVFAREHPNIVFIVTDDQGPWAMGAAGDPNAVTPNMDRLRAEGTQLTHCYTPTPVCSPARVSILTSRYGTELGITDFLPRLHEGLPGLSPDVPTWPRELAKAGYATALIGKYHCGDFPESHPTRIGYQEFRGFIHGGMVSQNPEVEVDGQVRTIEGWTPDILTDFALDYIHRHREGPFALSLHFWAPHANAGTNEEGDRTWLPLSDADLSPFRQLDPLLPEPDYPDLDIPRTKRMLREYLGSVHSVDRNLGRVLNLLDELQLTENTVVIFTADHGYNLGHHGIWHKGNGRWLLKHDQGHRANMWEQSLRVPALVKWPHEISADSTVTHSVSHLDWFPTILAMAGVDLPETTLRGRNVLPLLKGESVQGDEEFFAQYRMRKDHGDGADMRSYQTDRWKLIRYFRNKRPDEFYDRQQDPEESTNLHKSTAPEIQAAITELNAKLKAAMERIDDPLIAAKNSE